MLWYISTARRRLQHDAHRFGRALSLILHSCALPSRTQWLHGLFPSHLRFRARQNSHALLVRLLAWLELATASAPSCSSEAEEAERACVRWDLYASVPGGSTPRSGPAGPDMAPAALVAVGE